MIMYREIEAGNSHIMKVFFLLELVRMFEVLLKIVGQVSSDDLRPMLACLSLERLCQPIERMRGKEHHDNAASSREPVGK